MMKFVCCDIAGALFLNCAGRRRPVADFYKGKQIRFIVRTDGRPATTINTRG